MLLVQYIAIPYANRLCDRSDCAEPGDYSIVCMDGELTERLCARHTAQHMRGNAYALDPSPDPEAIEAEMQNELDKFA